MTGTNEHGTTTMGLIDLMTSLAIVFILLFSIFSTQATSEAQSPLQANTENVREVLRDHLGQFGLSLDADPHDPLTLIIVVPEKQLNFEFGQSRLSPQADRFLEAAMPFYATALCGPLRKKIDSLTIQGHTDDQGDDIYNLQLSQERSLAVMIKALEVVKRTTPFSYSCFKHLLSASGRGRQDLVYSSKGIVDQEQSRRVSFVIRLRPSNNSGRIPTSSRTGVLKG